jgi:CheY-like chemotaxis protein
LTTLPRGRHRPVLRCFPRADRAFHADVEAAAERDDELDGSDPDSARRLEAALRARYPGAIVRPQDDLATLGQSERVWYVFRRDDPTLPAEAGAPEGEEGEPGPAARFATRPAYSSARVAAMVGLPMSVLVGWAEGDGLVRPSRTSGGLPLYSRSDIDELLLAKRWTADGRSVDEIRELLAAQRSSSGARRGGSRRLLILLAERDPYAAEFAEYFLRTEGYDVEVALGAAESEASALELQPDLVIIELLISGGAGPELCARIKARGDTPVLAVSSLDHEDAALRAGADAFLAKPLDPLQFVGTIKDLLGESAMLRSMAGGPS